MSFGKKNYTPREWVDYHTKNKDSKSLKNFERNVFSFLTKDKYVVMEQKDLSSAQYNKRYAFMAEAYKILRNK